MTTETLKRYRRLQAEIDGLDEEIAELRAGKLTDTVKASLDEYPYTQHTVSISGCDDTVLDEIERKLRERARLLGLREEIEEYFDGIRDNYIRRIIKLKYKHGCSWGQIALKLGGNNTKDCVRKACKRFLENS